jgi:hypothetical protein
VSDIYKVIEILDLLDASEAINDLVLLGGFTISLGGYDKSH